MKTDVDHLVIAARDLAQGEAWAREVFGVATSGGGRHALMGTHNRLLRLDGRDDAYLEIIAIDPDAPPPGRARWFGLDTPALQEAVQAAPRLVHWVARTTNLDMHRYGLVAAGLQPGTTLTAQRATPQGVLRWRIVVADDGRPLFGGALPTLIEWQGAHPAPALPESGIMLAALRLRGLPATALQVLRPAGVTFADGPGPAVEATFTTPRGSITLSSPP